MTSLDAMQKGFVQAIIKPSQPNDFLVCLVRSGQLHAEEQLAIYQSNMRGVLQQTLAQIYPVCKKIVGDKYFKRLARVYIDENPSKKANLNCYGEGFSVFIYKQCLQRNELSDFPYLSDLVQLEWFYHAMYYAEEGAVFDLAGFAALRPDQQENCLFLLAPQLAFIHSNYPIASIWRLNQHDEKQQTLAANAESCCVFRAQNSLDIIDIDESMYQLLIAIKAGQTVEEISQIPAASHLPALIKSRWIAGFKVCHV